jgi:hypothetical protein
MLADLDPVISNVSAEHAGDDQGLGLPDDVRFGFGVNLSIFLFR